MQIRQATIDDVVPLAMMGMAFIDSTQYPMVFGHATELSVGTMLMQLLALPPALGEAWMGVAEDRRGIFGALVGVDMPHPLMPVRVFDEIGWWVEPSRRGHQAGPRLLQAAEGWARTRGLRFIKMVAPAASPAVGSFYARRGYAPLETAWFKEL